MWVSELSEDWKHRFPVESKKGSGATCDVIKTQGRLSQEVSALLWNDIKTESVSKLGRNKAPTAG